jgi:hypothetical protein
MDRPFFGNRFIFLIGKSGVSPAFAGLTSDLPDLNIGETWKEY